MALFDDFDAYPDGPLAGNGTWVDVSPNTGHNRVTSGDVTTTLALSNGSLTVPADIGSGNQFVEIDALDTPTGTEAGFPIALRAEDKLNFLGMRTLSDASFQVIDRISQTLNVLATTAPGFSLKNRNWRLRVHGTDFQASSGSLNLGFGQTNSNALIQRAGMLAWTDPSTPMTTWFQDVQTDALSTPDNTLNCRAPTAGWGEVSQGSVLGGTLGAYAIYMQFSPGDPGVATNDLIGLVGSHTGPGANRILARYNRSLPAIQFLYYGSDGSAVTNNLNLSQTLDPHYWNGIAYRWDGSTTKVFLYRTSDGGAQESAEVSATSQWTGSTLRMHFGATTSLTTMNGGGVFGEVAIYEGTIPTDAQLAQLCARTALASDFSPAHYYPLDTVAATGNAVDTVASADFSQNASAGLFNTFDIRTYPTPAAATGINGSFSVTEAGDAVALAGTVVAGPSVVAGSFDVTEAPDIAALTGLVVVSGVAAGAFNVTEAPDVVALAGTVIEGESGIITPELTFWWYPRADANDTPDTAGLITRPVNGEPGFTFEFGGVGGGSYRDSAGVLQTLPGSPTGDDIPRWDHRAASPHESLGLLVERNQVEWARRVNPSFGYVEAEGIFYVDIYYDAPRPAGTPHGIYLFLRTDVDNLITLNLNAGGGGGTLPTVQSLWGQIRASAQDQIMTFETPVDVAAGGRFRMAIGWTNVAAPADGTIMMYAGQQEDLAGIPVDWGNGLGLGVKIGEYNDTMDNVPITPTTRLMIPGDDSEVSGAAREARVHVLEARYYNKWLGETFMSQLTSGNVTEGNLPEPPALTNAYQMLV